MKLKYGRTMLVGLAFFSICAFWQLYDGIIPLILRDTFGMKDGPAGIVMSIDNILALFLLPLMGAFSDKKGRRLPFVAFGTLAAVILMMALPIIDNSYALMDHSAALIIFMVVLGALLIAMGSYRSPAVALMADVTPKPLRSKGNAVINLMGAFGGVYTLALIKFAVKSVDGQKTNYFYLFLGVALLMAVAVIVLLLTIRERKLVQEMKDINYGVPKAEEEAREVEVNGHKALAPDVRRSLILILATIALWFMGYNAVTTAFTKYATATWTGGLAQASTCLMVATVFAVISYLPIGLLSSRLGRKRMIQIGLGLAVLCFLYAAFFSHEFHFALYVVFALMGFAQAAITVNTFPMVWEISRLGSVGKYTGYYYTCSMAAQIVTPILSGYLIQWVGYKVLFPYAAVMVALAFLPICFAKHGDSRPDAPKDKLEAFDVNDG